MIVNHDDVTITFKVYNYCLVIFAVYSCSFVLVLISVIFIHCCKYSPCPLVYLHHIACLLFSNSTALYYKYSTARPKAPAAGGEGHFPPVAQRSSVGPYYLRPEKSFPIELSFIHTRLIVLHSSHMQDQYHLHRQR